MIKRIHNGHVLGVAAFLALPSCVLSTPFAAPLLSIAALAALLVTRINAGHWPKPQPALLLLLATIVGYGALSSLWAVQPRLSLVLAARLLGIFVAGLVLLDGAARLNLEQRRFFARAFLIGFVLGLLLLTVENVTDAALIGFLRELGFVKRIIGEQRPLYAYTYFNRVTTLAGLLLWPALAIVSPRYRASRALALAALAALAVFTGHSETAKVAFVSAGIVYLAARLRPRRAALLLGLAIMLDIVAAPFVLRPSVLGWVPHVLEQSGKAGSIRHRLEIWDFVTGRIVERPLLGWGLDSSRVIPGGHARTDLGGEVLPLHPHDMALQAWLELGALGVLVALSLVVIIACNCARFAPRPAAQAAALAALGATTVNAITGYDLWHPWWLSFLWLTAAFSAAALRAEALSDAPAPPA